MRSFEAAPDWEESFVDERKQFMEALHRPEVKAFVKRINEKYLFWDEAKYRVRPENISSAIGWGLVKISRISQINPINLQTVEGKSFGYWLPDSVLKELHFIDQNASGQLLVDEPAMREPDKDRY